MGQLMDFLELRDSYMRVNLSAFQASMSEHLLDVTNVCSVFEHQRGHGVT